MRANGAAVTDVGTGRLPARHAGRAADPSPRASDGRGVHRAAGPARRRHWKADVPAADALPIPDYDELSASQVVERLDGLDRESLDAIRRYETDHRGRNTILGKIAQLS